MTFGVRWMMPALQSFHRENPDESIVLTTPPNIYDISSGTIDVAILDGHGDWPGVIMHPLFPIELEPVCSPGLLEGGMKLNSPDDLSKVMLLHSIARPDDWAHWIGLAHASSVDPSSGAMFESSALSFEAALHDMGAAMGLRALVAPEIAAGRLVRPFEYTYRDGSSFYLVYSEKLADNIRIKRFCNWILKEASNYRERYALGN